MLLFKTTDVKRYFNILSKKGRVTENRYLGYDTKNPHIPYCEKEIFVKRTLNKWLKGRDIILYDLNANGIEFLNYVHIANVRFHLGYSDEIDVTLLSYNENHSWSVKKISYNNALLLEGEWSENSDLHKKINELTSMSNVPNKEYVYKVYDLSLSDQYPDLETSLLREKISSTISFFGKTQKSIDLQTENFSEKDKILGKLIEIKDVTIVF